MRTIVLATRNAHKAAELRAMLASMGTQVELVTLDDIGYDRDIVEDGATFAENAAKKAEQVYADTGMECAADDSGICADALGGAPGIHSARWSGGGDEANNDKMLAEMAGVPDGSRGAAFVCAIAHAGPAGTRIFTGECRGEILRVRAGVNGFGYDCLFYYPPLGRSFAQIPAEDKNLVSHRYKAAKAWAESIAR